MLRNYLTVAWRTLRRNPTYTLINTGGLALGLACCVLIALYVQDELSYDDFHENGDRLVFVGSGTAADGSLATPYPLAGALERELPGVARTIRVVWPGPGEVSRTGENFAEESGVFAAGPGFFEAFSFPLVQGEAALDEPGTVVLSEALAEKYFVGENPIGQTLYLNARGGEQAYRVTGVARSPENSYLSFGALYSLPTLGYAENYADQWGSFILLTFAELQPGASHQAFAEQATALLDRRYQKKYDRAGGNLFALPLEDLYLSPLVTPEGFRGEQRYLWIFGAVALFVLLLACVNYVNLSTAQAAQRAKEVGVRRTVGATRLQVARQFLGESVLLTSVAFVLALVLARAALPVFNHLTDKNLSLLAGHVGFAGMLGAVALGVGLAAGAYPALFLSGFRPTDVLRGGGRGRRGNAWLRKGLVTLQFAVAVALIAATGVVYQQLRYTQTKDLGFEKEQVVTVDVPGDAGEAFRREVLAHPAVRSASIANAAPGQFRLGLGLDTENISSQAQTQEESIAFKPAVVDTSFVETMGLRLAAGRAFSSNRPSDRNAFILNEAFAQKLGWTPEEAVGKTIDLRGSGEVIGVVENFHITSLREKIEPVAMSLTEFEGVSSSPVLAARFAPERTGAALAHLEATWAQFSEEPLDYIFLDQEFAEMYRTERRLGQVFTAFAVVAVLIACLGLFGLAAFAAERRSKEIAIRKTFGASARQIVGLLSKEFLLLVAVGFVLAVPAAWYAMRRWLEDFAYRLELSPWLFAAAGLAALLVATGATSWQAWRAARTNPAQALRDE